MKLHLPSRYGIVLLFVCIYGITQANTTLDSDARSKAENALKKYQEILQFEENKGQWDATIKYQAKTNQAVYRILDNTISFATMHATTINVPSEESLCFERERQLAKMSKAARGKAVYEAAKKHSENRQQGLDIVESEMDQPTEGFVWNMVFENTNPNKQIVSKGLRLGDGSKNYFKANALNSQDVIDVKHYNEVWYKSIYEQIDLRLYSKGDGSLEYDFIVYPHANIEAISFSLEGLDNLSVNEFGELVLHTPFGELKQGSPYTYQVVNGAEVEISSAYLLKDGKVSFQLLQDYDPALPIIIDPTALMYATYVSGSDYDYIQKMEINDAGEMFMVGRTRSVDYPVTAGAFQTTKSTGTNVYQYDAFVTRLSADGSSLIYSTYIGGSDYDYAYDLALDDNDHAYICGFTRSPNYPTTVGAFQDSLNTPNNATWTSYDAFITKLNPTGTALIYSTYLGGENYDNGYHLDVNDQDEVFVTGYTYSTDFPITSGAFQDSLSGYDNLFVTKLTADGSNVVYSTYFGGFSYTDVKGLVVGPSDEVIIAGTDYGYYYYYWYYYTGGQGIPTTPGAFQEVPLSTYEAPFVTKFSNDGTRLIYSTYLTGSNYESIIDLEVNDDNEAFVIGSTGSSDFPTTPGAFMAANPSSNNSNTAFITRFREDGTDLIYSTYLGGSNYGYCRALALNGDEAYITGYTTSADFPITSCAYQTTLLPQSSTSTYLSSNFISRLNDSGSDLLYSTYFGSRSVNYDIDVGGDGSVYVAGYAYNSNNQYNYVITANAYQTTVPTHSNGTTQSGTHAVKFAFYSGIDENTIDSFYQIACINGSPEVIEGTNPISIPFTLPDLLVNGVATSQLTNTSFNYIWEESTDSINWTPLVGAIQQDYLPTPTNSTTYYRRIVSEDCGNGIADTSNVHTLVINLNQAPQIAMPDNQSICSGGNTQIGGTPTASGGTGQGTYTYFWTPPIGLSDSSIANPIATPSQSTIYSLEVIDSNGCTTNEQTVVTVALANAGVDQFVCNSSFGVQIGTPAVPNVPPFQYTWTPAVGLSDTSVAQPIANPTDTMLYTLTVNGGNGCPISDQVLVLPQEAIIANAGPDTAVCLDKGIRIGSPRVTGYSYYWTSPISNISGYTSPTPYIYARFIPTINPVPYFLRVTDDATGCTALDTVFVRIEGPIDYQLPPFVCGDSVVLGYPDSINSYQWSPTSNLSDATVAQPVAQVTVPTTYSVTITSPLGCITDGGSIRVYPSAYCAGGGSPGGGGSGGVPNCKIPDLGPNAGIICLDDSVQIGPDPNAVYEYEWVPPTGLSNPNISNPIANPTVTTTYTLLATVPSFPNLKCTDSITVYVPDSLISINAQDTAICLGSGAVIGSPALPGFSYEWTPATGLNYNTLAEPTASPIQNTRYEVTATQAYTGCQVKDTMNLTVRHIVADAGEDGSFCDGAFFRLGAPAAPDLTYNWTPSIGLSDPTTAQPTITLYTGVSFILAVTDTITGCIERDTVNFTESPRLLANAGLDTLICPDGLGTQLGTTDSSAAGYNYAWSPALGLNNANSPLPTATPTTTTTYTLTVSSPNRVGCNGYDAITVDVVELPVVQLADVSICPNESIVIGDIPNPDLTYSWTPSIGLTDPTIAQPSANPDTTTIYTLTVTDAPSGCSQTYQTEVTIGIAYADAGQDTAICNNGGGIAIGSTALTNYTYNWSPSTGLSSNTAAQPIASPSNTQTYIITATDEDGCIGQDTVIVGTFPQVTADAGSETANICVGGLGTQIGTTDSSAYGYIYSWSPATGLSDPNIANPIANPNVDITYTLTVSDPSRPNCSNTDRIEVLIQNAAGPTIQVSNQSICLGDSMIIGPTNTSTNVIYNWQTSPSLIGTTDSRLTTVQPSNDETYSITVTDTLTGCASTATIDVMIKALPMADAGLDKEVCSATAIQIGTVNQTGLTYEWSPNTGLDDHLIANPIATTTNNQDYILTVTNTDGCIAKDTMTIDTYTLPSANAGPDQSNCGSVSIGLNTGNNIYNWAPITGLSNPNIATPIANPSDTILYVLTVTSVNGCVSRDTVIVMPLIINAATMSNLASICQGNTVVLGTPEISPYIYSWSPTTGLNDPNAAQPTAAPTTNTTYTRTITYNGCTTTDDVTVNVRSIVADAGTSNLVCQNSTLQIGAPDNLAYEYLWTPSTGLSDPYVSNPTVNITNASMTYYLIVRDLASGCTASDTVVINVVTAPAPIADAGIDQAACQNTGITLGSPAVQGISYTWSPSAGLNNPFIAQPHATPVTTTTYTLTVVNSDGCSSVDDVTITPYIQYAYAGGDRTACYGDSARIFASNYGGNKSYVWTPPIGLSDPTIFNPVAMPPVTTVYTLTITDLATGCFASDQVRVTIDRTPVSQAANAGNNQTFCIGTPINLGANPIAGVNYDWCLYGLDTTLQACTNGISLNDGSIANPTSTIDSSAIYVITARSQNYAACVAKDTVIIHIVPPPTIDAGNDYTICEGDNNPIILGTIPTLSDTGSNTTYSWFPTSGLSDPTIAQPTALPNVTTTYTLSVSNDGCGPFTEDVTVTISGLPIVDAGPDFSVCSNNGAVIGLYSATPGYTYTWSPAIGLSDSTAAQPFAAPTSNTSYVLNVSHNSTGCSNTDTILVSSTIDVIDFEYDDFCGTTAVPITSIGHTAGGYYNLSSQSVLTTEQIDTATGVISGAVAGMTYQITYTSPSGICQNTASQNVAAYASPQPQFTTPTTAVCDNEGMLTYTLNNSYTNHSWTITNGSIINGGGNGDNTISIIWDTVGTSALFGMGYVEVTVENSIGCQETLNLAIERCGLPQFANVASAVTVECDDIPNGIPALVACNTSAVTITNADNVTPGSCSNEYVINRTWSATDRCGNTTNMVQSITVIDTTGPMYVEAPQGLDREVPCDNSIIYTAALSLAPSPYDDCSPIIPLPEPTTNTFNGPFCEDGQFKMYQTRTWAYMDECGNQSIYTQVVTIIDTVPHYFLDVAGDLDRYVGGDIDAFNDAMQLNPTMTDRCMPVGMLTASYQIDTIPNDCRPDMTDVRRIWTYYDPCLEVSRTYEQRITFDQGIWGGADCRIDIHEPNNIFSNPAYIYHGWGNHIRRRLSICTFRDKDYFAFSTTPTKRNVHIKLYDLPLDFRLTLYDRATETVLDVSDNDCTTDEHIYRNNLPVGDYVVLVDGNGNWHPTEPYSLDINLSSQSYQTGPKNPVTINPIYPTTPSPNPNPPGGTKPSYTIPFAYKVANNVLQLYPNPAKDYIYLNLPKSLSGEILVVILSMDGKQLYEEKRTVENGSNLELNISDLVSGTYILDIKDQNENYKQKFIVLD